MDTVVALLQSLALSPQELSRRTKLSVHRVSELVGGARPNAAELRALADGLRLPLRAFATGSRPSLSNDRLSPRFRKLPTWADDVLEPTHEFVAEFVDAATTVLPARSARPEWLDLFGTVDTTYRGAQALAGSFRAWLAAGNESAPLLNLPSLCDRIPGLILSQLRHSKYEGASLLASGYVFIFVSPRFSGRTLFTLAHELGHVLAHHLTDDDLRFETASNISRPSSSMERFVDAFASILLLPDRGVGEALALIRQQLGMNGDQVSDIEILTLSRYFGVSFEVAARRCETLSILPSGGAQSLVDSVKKRHASAEQLASRLGLLPRPPITFPLVSSELIRETLRHIEQGTISETWISSRLGLSIEEIQNFNMRENRV